MHACLYMLVQTCTCLCKPVHACASLCMLVQACACLCKPVHACASLCMLVQACACLCKPVHAITNLPSCTSFCNPVSLLLMVNWHDQIFWSRCFLDFLCPIEIAKNFGAFVHHVTKKKVKPLTTMNKECQKSTNFASMTSDFKENNPTFMSSPVPGYRARERGKPQDVLQSICNVYPFLHHPIKIGSYILCNRMWIHI